MNEILYDSKLSDDEKLRRYLLVLRRFILSQRSSVEHPLTTSDPSKAIISDEPIKEIISPGKRTTTEPITLTRDPKAKRRRIEQEGYDFSKEFYDQFTAEKEPITDESIYNSADDEENEEEEQQQPRAGNVVGFSSEGVPNIGDQTKLNLPNYYIQKSILRYFLQKNKRKLITDLLETREKGKKTPLIKYTMSGQLLRDGVPIPKSNIILSLRHHFNEVRSKGQKPRGHDYFEKLIRETQQGKGIRKPMTQKKWISYR